MKFETFEKLMNERRKYGNTMTELYGIGFDFFEGKYQIAGQIDEIYKAIMVDCFGDDGWEWIEWFIYEADYGDNYSKDKDSNVGVGAWDETGNPICYDYQSLYDHINSIKTK